MNIDRAIKTKRIPKRGSFVDRKANRSKKSYEEEEELGDMVEESIQEPIQTINYDDMLRKCQKILALLRKNKNSWPFREPVDPIAMGIPHYRDIITNPMDLKTV